MSPRTYGDKTCHQNQSLNSCVYDVDMAVPILHLVSYNIFVYAIITIYSFQFTLSNPRTHLPSFCWEIYHELSPVICLIHCCSLCFVPLLLALVDCCVYFVLMNLKGAHRYRYVDQNTYTAPTQRNKLLCDEDTSNHFNRTMCGVLWQTFLLYLNWVR